MRRFIAAAAIAACAVVAAFAAACPPSAQAGFAPTATQLSDPTAHITSTTEAVDTSGNTTAVWEQSPTNSGNVDDVDARRIAADGSLGPQIQLSATGADSFQPVVSVGPSGAAFVAWRVGGSPNLVEGRWLNPNGSTGLILTIETDSGTESAAQAHAVVSANGVATVAWYNQLMSDRVELVRISPDGTESAQVNTTLGAAGGGFGAAALPGGATFLVGGAVTDVVDASGTAGATVDAHTSGTVSTLNTGLAFDQQGDGLIAWRRGLSPPFAIVARRIDATGAPIGSEIVVASDPTAFFGAYQQAAVDSNGHFLVGWDEQDSGNEGHAYVRAVNADGSFADVSHFVSGLSEPDAQALVALDDRGFGIAAFDFLADDAATDVVQGQVLGAGGAPIGGPATLTGTSSGSGSSLANDPATGVAAVAFEQPSGAKQVVMASRYMEPPTCTDSSATVVLGRPIDAQLSCTGIGINGARVVTAPAHGTVGAFTESGLTLHYTPTPGYRGSDSFVYQGVNDGGASANATVRITVGSALATPDVPPVVKSFKLRRVRVHARKRGGKPAPMTFTDSFVLTFSKPSTVRVTITQPTRGVRAGKSCRPRPKHPPKHAKGCTLYRTVGSVSSRKLAGSTTLALSSGLVRRLSRLGALRASATASDAAGKASTPRMLAVRFHVTG